MVEIRTSGVLLSEERPVNPFTALQLGVHGVVEIAQSPEAEKVVLEGDEALFQDVEIVHSGRTLYVNTKKRFLRPRFGKLVVRVFARNLDTLEICCHGEVRTTTPIVADEELRLKIYSHGSASLDIRTPTLTASIASHGSIVIEGECWDANIHNASHGDIDLSRLSAVHLSLVNMGHGKVQVYAGQSIQVKHMGHGDVLNHGPAQLDDVLHFGHGDVRRA